MNEIAVIAPSSRMPLDAGAAQALGITAGQWRVLIDQIFPSAKTVDAVLLAVTYCKERKLDVYKKPVHIVPMYSSALKREVETVWPGISEIRTTASRTGEYLGIDEIEYGPEETKTFTGKNYKNEPISATVTFPKWAKVTVWRLVQGQTAAFHCRVLWEEAYARISQTDVPNSMWCKRTYGQIDKCVEAAALRMAFPEEIGGTMTAEEMEGLTTDAGGSPVPEKKRAPAPDKQIAEVKLEDKPAETTARKKAPPPPEKKAATVTERVEDAEFEEVTDREPSGDDRAPEGFFETTGDDEIDPSELLTALDNALQAAVNKEAVEEIYNEHDLEARLSSVNEGTFVTVAQAMKRRALKRVGE